MGVEGQDCKWSKHADVVQLIPVDVDALQTAVGVSAGEGDRVPGVVQTQRAAVGGRGHRVAAGLSHDGVHRGGSPPAR